LQDRDTLATEDLSVADITALVAVDFARVVRLRPGEQHGHLLRWQARLNARPAFR
jgi:glutathione S-transferase